MNVFDHRPDWEASYTLYTLEYQLHQSLNLQTSGPLHKVAFMNTESVNTKMWETLGCPFDEAGG